MHGIPPRQNWIPCVQAALEEDIGAGDATSEALIPISLQGSARCESRQEIVLAGIEIAAETFRRCGARLETGRTDGTVCASNRVLATVRGPARAILAAERTALNFLQHLSGIATLTRAYRAALGGTAVELVDTRKTTPGWRALEKYAVRCGGGRNHRIGLYDAILIKDNHIVAAGSLRTAMDRVRSHNPACLPVQVEVESAEQARSAIGAGAEALLIDNQTPAELARIVRDARSLSPQIVLEASGGITLEHIAEVARTGVDRISVGCLTHSAPAADIALEWNEHSSK